MTDDQQMYDIGQYMMINATSRFQSFWGVELMMFGPGMTKKLRDRYHNDFLFYMTGRIEGIGGPQ